MKTSIVELATCHLTCSHYVTSHVHIMSLHVFTLCHSICSYYVTSHVHIMSLNMFTCHFTFSPYATQRVHIMSLHRGMFHFLFKDSSCLKHYLINEQGVICSESCKNSAIGIYLKRFLQVTLTVPILNDLLLSHSLESCVDITMSV